MRQVLFMRGGFLVANVRQILGESLESFAAGVDRVAAGLGVTSRDNQGQIIPYKYDVSTRAMTTRIHLS